MEIWREKETRETERPKTKIQTNSWEELKIEEETRERDYRNRERERE